MGQNAKNPAEIPLKLPARQTGYICLKMIDMTPRQTIEDFLSVKRLAIVGVSRNPADFTRTMFAEFRRRGYDVVPVTPQASEIEGVPAFGRVQDITPPVDGALVMTQPAITDRVVRDCAEANISRIWMYRAGGSGAVSSGAVAFCEAHQMRVVPGECPFMFFPKNGLHAVHGWIRRLTGKYPE